MLDQFEWCANAAIQPFSTFITVDFDAENNDFSANVWTCQHVMLNMIM